MSGRVIECSGSELGEERRREIYHTDEGRLAALLRVAHAASVEMWQPPRLMMDSFQGPTSFP